MCSVVAAIATMMQSKTDSDMQEGQGLQDCTSDSTRRRPLQKFAHAILGVLDAKGLFYKVVVEQTTKVKMLDKDYGPRYIKPRSLH